MNNIFITGSNGFVGKNLLQHLSKLFDITKYERGDIININHDIVIHLAGKAHDLKNTSNPDQYYQVNTEFTKVIFDNFLESNASVFITLSSVKAAADILDSILTEDFTPNPITHYGKSKLLAEEYILSKKIPEDKRVYILRPCMIHGSGNKGNLNLLYKIISKGFPWPLGAFKNKRSFSSIDNLCFIINELINNQTIPSGIYNIADDEPITINNIINLIAESQDKKYHIWNIPQSIIKLLFKIGDFLKFPLNSERFNKLTQTYIVSNNKIKKAINKPLPLSTKDGLMKTFNSFNSNAK